MLGRIPADRLEELSDLLASSRKLAGKDGRLCVAGQLPSAGVLHATADAELPRAYGAKVVNPLRRPAGSDEVAAAVDVDQVDHRRAHCSTPAADHTRLAAAEHAHAVPGEPAHRPVEHVPRRPPGLDVVIVWRRPP